MVSFVDISPFRAVSTMLTLLLVFGSGFVTGSLSAGVSAVESPYNVFVVFKHFHYKIFIKIFFINF